ncbi:MAG: hypothetical protein LQ340_002024 [Diploschistes diacapsis]|nr:MAG: hypothetical protein LQ340_002024 [Diploschistes diacapsis]
MPFGFGRKTQTVEGTEVSPRPSQEFNEKDGGLAGVEKSTGIDGSVRRMSEVEANRELKFLKKMHRWDPNMSSDVNEGMSRAVADHDVTAELELINLIENDSPYPEVRAAVRNYDEEMPANTIRAWVIGMLMVTLGSAMNMLFSLRNPSIVITAFVAQLVAYPFGCLWDLVMPKFLCPGKFNMKEHTLITVMANVAYSGTGGAAYSTDTIVAMKGFYGYDFGWGFQLLLTLSTQMLGYGFAGLLRKFLVWPASMIWPSNLVNTTLFYALHDHSATDPSKTNGWRIGRYWYFLIVFCCSFCWYFFPGWIFQALSYFAFATWIAPNNVVVNQLFGYTSGLGLIPITFDWTQITGFTLSPLMFPWHAIANTLIGVVLFFMVTSAGLHYSNWGFGTYLPMSTSSSYDNTGNVYNVSRILTPEFELDLNAYQQYSPLFLSTTFALTYGLSFATILALITHTVLFHGQEIWVRARLSLGEEPDVHTKMMRKYPEAPWWWYAITFLIMFGFSLATALAWDTHLTWWALIVSLIIAGVFCIPIGMVQAITNIQLGLNVITEFIIGYMQPGRPLAMMMFKTYGYIAMAQALAFASDLKMGHYIKVPPRTLFAGQVVATVWSCVVQIAVLNWAFGSVADICDPEQVNHYTCPGGRVFFNASVIWGLIGPQRIFGAGQIYNGLMYFFIAGALGPPIFYLLARMFPKSQFRYVNVPLIFGGSGMIPPATTINYTSWGVVGFVFNKVIKNRYRGWWSHYNYVTSAGLDCGLAISTILIFLALQLTAANPPDWWGNNVMVTTLDFQGAAVQNIVPEGKTFGPSTW